ncbi:Fur family transcriptional regulator [Peptostreptococcus canis]|uniref:Transcriptional repressor n=1 Tax=Peptostreptococcus canis TaxID=1159213 RepID=A0ABR6TN02_9FIRM|nr:Fur family transcriptional regulator [Peptostreptococcus canis]MBC2576792.1 transcriptional repressor [Peptostreptococcus canis]MBP1998905.1 Fur family ferric uptake transcriptional regulator [Peptostreptococcus canis]
MEKTMDILKEKLKATGFKITPQRRAIIEVLIENENSHLSSEEIYDKVRANCPEIGLATVYRTMQLLDEINGISKLNLDDGCIRYEINIEGEENHHHHHLICKECGAIIEVKEDLLEAIEEKVENMYNFEIFDHDLKFYGKCENCQKKK